MAGSFKIGNLKKQYLPPLYFSYPWEIGIDLIAAVASGQFYSFPCTRLVAFLLLRPESLYGRVAFNGDVGLEENERKMSGDPLRELKLKTGVVSRYVI